MEFITFVFLALTPSGEYIMKPGITEKECLKMMELVMPYSETQQWMIYCDVEGTDV